MPYIFNDEDNEPMNDPIENLNNITGYLSFEEMRVVDSGEFSAHLDERIGKDSNKHNDFIGWVKDTLPRYSCASCPTASRI